MTRKSQATGKKGRKIATTMVALSSLCAFKPVPAAAATATMTVKARLVEILEITVQESLNFGTLALTLEEAGAARIDPEQEQLIIDDESGLALAGGQPKAGRLHIRGGNIPVEVSMEDTSIKLTNGTATISVTDINLQTADGGVNITVTPQAGNPTVTIPVGGRLEIGQGQLTGTYAGTTRIFATYQ